MKQINTARKTGMLQQTVRVRCAGLLPHIRSGRPGKEREEEMTYEQIETFLAVVTYGSVSEAARKLFVSQSTVSSRLQQLEEELGTKLLTRSRGQRSIELTSYGDSFIALAGRWAALWKETQNLKTLSDIQPLTIASVDAINSFTFVPLFNSVADRHPEIRLAVRTHHSDEIHGLVENRTADIGFVFSQTRYPDIVSKPVYRELMYLLCRSDSPYGDGISCAELEPENEIYIRWGTDFQEWHDRNWSPERYCRISVNTGSMLKNYLNRPERWAVAPMSVIQAMRHDTNLTYHVLRDPPNPRICYQLTNRYPNARQRKVIELFEEELTQFVAGSGDICRFEDWMLSQTAGRQGISEGSGKQK